MQEGLDLVGQLSNCHERVEAICVTNHDCWPRGHASPTTPHNDALVIQLKIANAMIRQLLVDTGSSIDIITL